MSNLIHPCNVPSSEHYSDPVNGIGFNLFHETSPSQGCYGKSCYSPNLTRHNPGFLHSCCLFRRYPAVRKIGQQAIIRTDGAKLYSSPAGCHPAGCQFYLAEREYSSKGKHAALQLYLLPHVFGRASDYFLADAGAHLDIETE